LKPRLLFQEIIDETSRPFALTIDVPTFKEFMDAKGILYDAFKAFNEI
jgi:hypothetical protein